MGRATQSSGNTSRPSTRRINATDRQRQALDLRKAGATYEQIAERCGYGSRASAYKAVTKALQTTLREPADELRVLESERLDRLLLTVWKMALGGDLKAVDRALRILEQRSKLLGLNTPPSLSTASNDDAVSAIGQIGEALVAVARGFDNGGA